MASELKFVKRRGYENYNTKKNKIEHKEETKADEEETAEEHEAPVPLVTQVNNILHSINSNVEVYISSQQLFNSNRLYASYNSNKFQGVFSEYRGVLHCEGYDYEEIFDEILEAFFVNLFSQRQ